MVLHSVFRNKNFFSFSFILYLLSLSNFLFNLPLYFPNCSSGFSGTGLLGKSNKYSPDTEGSEKEQNRRDRDRGGVSGPMTILTAIQRKVSNEFLSDMLLPNTGVVKKSR